MALIIYAEDDELMADIVRSILSDAGHIVGIVGDGAAAFQAIKFKQPDLVILDCTLPGLPGIQVLRKMRIDPVLCDLPVLMLTGRNSQDDVNLAKFAGANEYLKKPFDPDHLVFIVENMLDAGSAARQQTG